MDLKELERKVAWFPDSQVVKKLSDEIKRLTQLCEEQGGRREKLTHRLHTAHGLNEGLTVCNIRQAETIRGYKEDLLNAESALSQAREEVERGERTLAYLKEADGAEIQRLTNELEASEQREKVLREALEKIADIDCICYGLSVGNKDCNCPACIATAALAAASEVGSEN